MSNVNLRITHTRVDNVLLGEERDALRTPTAFCRLELYPSKANRKPAIKTDSTDPMVRALAATPNTVAASATRLLEGNILVERLQQSPRMLRVTARVGSRPPADISRSIARRSDAIAGAARWIGTISRRRLRGENMIAMFRPIATRRPQSTPPRDTYAAAGTDTFSTSSSTTRSACVDPQVDRTGGGTRARPFSAPVAS